jgi:histidyl-tRNA synthetase
LEFGLPRGMRDILPEEFESAEIIRSAFLDTSRLFDYKIMEPSPLELVETLEAKSGPSIRDEIYFFKDKSQRELGLRFDLTLGLTRYVSSRKDLSPPIRVGSFASVWRYEEPQYGKYRWFYQWDAELFGHPKDVEADAEVIEFSSTIFRKIGAKPKILIGSRRVIEEFVRKELQIVDENKILDILRAIDKLSKKSISQIAEEYSNSFSLQDFNKVVKFVRTEGKAPSSSSDLYGLSGDNKVDLSGVLEIIDSLKARGVQDVEIDLSIARGLDYYTDMVFEAIDSKDTKVGSLCGGGRYDSLPPLYGRPDLGATGVAGGIERAILAIGSKSLSQNFQGRKKAFVAPVGDKKEIVREAASAAAELRRNDIPAQSEITGKSLRKILEAQSGSGVEAIVLIGERELTSRSVKIKWMKEGKEETVKREDLVRVLKSA